MALQEQILANKIHETKKLIILESQDIEIDVEMTAYIGYT